MSCIEEDTGFKYRSFGQQGELGQNRFGVQGGADIWSSGRSMEFGWMRGSRREEQNQDKGVTKGGNYKIGRV